MSDDEIIVVDNSMDGPPPAIVVPDVMDAQPIVEPQPSAPPPAPPRVTMLKFFSKTERVIAKEDTKRPAPAFNKKHVEQFQTRREKFDEILGGSPATGNYLSDLRSEAHKPFRADNKTRGSLRARLFQFSEDVRPPYFGTWQKRSKLISGRRPFRQDTGVFDYEVDSEAEWDLGGPGESLHGDDSEDDEESDDYEVDMKTFVPHGYVSDDEKANSDNEENAPANQSFADVIEIDVSSDANDDSNSNEHISPKHPPPALPVKRTPKMELKPIALGLHYEDSPTLSEAKLQFLRSFQGVSCTVRST